MAYAAAEIAIQQGIVRTQAVTMLPTTPHFTAWALTVEPTPIITVETMWVVLNGIPKCDAVIMIAALEKSAAAPFIGFILMIFLPIVLMIFQPPDIVPKAIVIAQMIFT